MLKKLFTVLIICVSMVCIGSSIAYFNDYRMIYHNEQLYKQLSEEVLKDEKPTTSKCIDVPKSVVTTKDSSIEPEPTKIPETREPVIMEKYQELYNENSDLVGWLKIGNIIDYPVLMNKEDSDYYIHRDFNKKDSKYGSIYINNQCDLSLPSSISLIYGHCMKDGSMFGKLKKYLDENFYEQNRIIELDSLYEESKYQVVGVFLSSIYYQDELDVFKYYNYKGVLSEDSFSEYKDGVSKLLRTGDLSEVKYGDTLVELITCSYHEEEVKLIVLCKKIDK